MANSRFHVLFSDIGGVLGTNGWDTSLRRKVAKHFHLDFEELESRHGLVFDSFERGYMSFEDYLHHVFFRHRKQPFAMEEVRDFAFHQSVAWPENIDLLRRVKQLNTIKLAFISNEGEGLTGHRVNKWGLRDIADFLVFSYAVHMRKPDTAIWKLALDLAQAQVTEAIYIDDRIMFVEIARDLGFTAFQHVTLEETRKQLEELGLKTEEA